MEPGPLICGSIVRAMLWLVDANLVHWDEAVGLISCPLSLSQTIRDSWSLEDLFMSLVQTTCLFGAAVYPGTGKSIAVEGTQLGRLSSRLYLTIA